MTKSQEENLKVVHRLHQALEAMDWKKVEEILAEDAVMGQPGQPRTHGGKQIIERLVEGLVNNLKMTSLRCEILTLEAVGPYIIDDRIDRVTIGDKKQGVHVAGSYLVENGKILDWTEWVSAEDMDDLEKLASG